MSPSPFSGEGSFALQAILAVSGHASDRRGGGASATRRACMKPGMRMTPCRAAQASQKGASGPKCHQGWETCSRIAGGKHFGCVDIYSSLYLSLVSILGTEEACSGMTMRTYDGVSAEKTLGFGHWALNTWSSLIVLSHFSKPLILNKWLNELTCCQMSVSILRLAGSLIQWRSLSLQVATEH